jgi:anti-sigma factor RsiW
MRECNKYIQDIADYIDGEADESLCAELEKHLKDCENCRIMVDTLRKTVVLCREGKRENLPPELSAKLNSALREKWDSKFKKE